MARIRARFGTYRGLAPVLGPEMAAVLAAMLAAEMAKT